MLAGISSDYYLRLEQGRDTHPSTQVLDALARALRLDLEATEYLHQLVSGSDREQPSQRVPVNGLVELIDQFPMPAFVANKYLDVLAANATARALSPGFTPGQNYLRWRLVDPAAREFFVDWEEATAVAVSGWREVAGNTSNDLHMLALIEEFSTISERFRELWMRADVGYRAGITHVRHPVVGELQLHRHRLSVPHSGGQHVILFRADPGSPSARALDELRFVR